MHEQFMALKFTEPWRGRCVQNCAKHDYDLEITLFGHINILKHIT